MDRLLVVWILGAMVIGVVCGKFAPVLRDRFAVAELYGTPLPIAVGLWLMMWPVLSKVRAQVAACQCSLVQGWQASLLRIHFANTREPGDQASTWGVWHDRRQV